MPETNTGSLAVKKKQSLGRGLGSLLSGAADAPVRGAPSTPPHATSLSDTKETPQILEENQIWKLPIDRLIPNKQQPRQVFSQEALKDLAASIKEKGVLQPIVARRAGEREFEIIAGERRWRAAQAAGLHEVPVILKKVTEQDSLELAIIENIQRENFNPMEEAEAYEHLLSRYGLTQQQVADKLGKERSSVANSLRMLALSAEIKEMVRSADLSPGHAKVLLALSDPDAQLSIAKEIVREKLSVRAAERLVAKARSSEKKGLTTPAPLDLDVPRRLIEGLSQELQKLVGTKVAIDYSEGKGKLQIHFYSDDQLTQIIEKIRGAWEK